MCYLCDFSTQRDLHSAISAAQCAENAAICADRENTYCANIPGSHECRTCDAACSGGCKGPGSSQCLGCAAGYEADTKAGGCRDVDECARGDVTCPAGELLHGMDEEEALV